MWVIIIKKYRSYEMGVKKLYKRALIGAVCSLGFAFAGTASAVDWLMLQGTEPQDASVPVKVWGYIQGNFQKDYSSPSAVGQYVPAKVLGPDLASQSGFNLSHAQIGVRGTAFPIDDHVNYMLLLEAGNAGTTHSASEYTFAKLTDASVTLNYIQGARIRAGLFKYPGAEEGLQAYIANDYINFTEVTNGLLLERFPNHAYTANVPGQTLAQLQNGALLNGFNAPVGAFRDVGVQVFDTFDMGNDWGLSYAAMVGQGNGIEFDNIDGKYDTYLYLSTEKSLGGTGPKADGLKFFAWNQSGQRLLDNTPCAAATCVAADVNPKFYKRDRSGLGMKYMAKPYRVTAEYITANGMIFEGPDKPSYYFAALPSATGVNNGADAKANGWYLEGGWYIPNTRWELDARYDTTDFNTGRVDEHKFSKWTLGTQYHFNPMTRVTVNYELRDFKCTASTPQCTSANLNLSGVGNKLGVQLTAGF
jgi:hypothetical protein